MVKEILGRAGAIYRLHFPVIAGVVIVVWLPIGLLSQHSSRSISTLLEGLIGSIGTAGVISIGYSVYDGRHPTFRDSISAGFGSWGRVLWTRILKSWAIAIGLILLIIPGIFLLVRLALSESLAVRERTSGLTAMGLSYDATRGHFWSIVRLGFASAALAIIPIGIITLPYFILPELDSLLYDAFATICIYIFWTYVVLCMVCAQIYIAEYPTRAKSGGPQLYEASPLDETPIAGEPGSEETA